MTSPARTSTRLGRHVGIGVFGAIVAGMTLVFSIQIIQQAFPQPAPQANRPCDATLLQLIDSLEQARQSASREKDEGAAIGTFRAVLANSAWGDAPGVLAACNRSAQTRRRLARVQRLRYAEEHAVRYEARAVARDRQAVKRLRFELEQAQTALESTSASH